MRMNRHERRRAGKAKPEAKPRTQLPGLPKTELPPRLPNAGKDRLPVQVTLQERVVVDVGSVCPACKATINEPLPQAVVVQLKSGQTIETGCGRCGQPMVLQYDGEAGGRRIMTLGEDLALRARGQ